MRPVINRAGHDFETEALVIRTDYSDDEAWRAVVALLDQSDGEFEVRHHLVDDRAYAGASPDEMALSPWPPARDSKWCSWPTPPR